MKKLALSAVLAASFAFGVDYEDLALQCVQGGNEAACNRLESLCNNKDGEACFAMGVVAEAKLKVIKMSKAEQRETFLKMFDSYARGCNFGSRRSCEREYAIERILNK